MPFLGLIGETLDVAIKTDMDIVARASPTAQGYAINLRKFPALLAVNLTHHLMEGLGQTGHFDVYTYIQKAMGSEHPLPLTLTDKERLWRAFRYAILELGFEPSSRTSGPHYMADEYLRQTGVPLAFADSLAKRMMVFARAFGLPDEYNPHAITNWQSAMEQRLGPPFSITARKAVKRDTYGYYTQAFLRLVKSQWYVGSTANAIEKAMARAFEGGVGVSFKRAVLPYLFNNEGMLGVYVPAGDSREFELRVNEERQFFRSGVEDKFVGINGDLPTEVIILDVTTGQEHRYSLWEDSRANRVLVFTDRGLWKARAQLGQGGPLELSPGKYKLISRFEPNDTEVEVLQEDPQLFTFELTLHPGQRYVLSNGLATLEIQGEDQPFAAWQGTSRTTRDGVEFFFDDLKLDLEFPLGWLAVTGRNYVLRLTAKGINESLERPFLFDDEGKSSLSLTHFAQECSWNAGFGRLKAEIYRIGEKRVLLRCSTFYWHGLKSISQGMRFECTQPPANINMILCENVAGNGASFAPGDLLGRYLRFVFTIDERRTQSLTWNVPGVFVEVELLTEDGEIKRLRRGVGSVEVVSHVTHKQILICASDPGELRIGYWTQRVDFSRFPIKRLSAAFLVGRITSDSNILQYRNSRTGMDSDLLRLVQPHYVDKMSASICNNQFVIRITTPLDIDGLLVKASNVASGEGLEVKLVANESEWSTHRFGRARLMVVPQKGNKYVALTYFDLRHWPKGGWIFRFEGKVGSSWGRLETERQEQCAASLICNENGTVDPNQKAAEIILQASFRGLEDRDALTVLERSQATLQILYSPESMEDLRWLEEIWDSVVGRWRGRESDAGTRLLSMLGSSRDGEEAGLRLRPRLIQVALPKILGLSAAAYEGVKDSGHPLTQALSLLPAVRVNVQCLLRNTLHPAAVMGFTNSLEVDQGSRPKGFSLSRYTEALKRMLAGENLYRLDEEGYRPSPRDFLGPLHYVYSARKLEGAYDRTPLAYQSTRGQAINLCRHIRRLMPSLTRDDSANLAGQSPHIQPWPEDEVLADDVAQRKEDLANIAHFLSWYAYRSRLEAESPGSQGELLNKLNSAGIAVKKPLTYLFQVGDALFAYYLLLWELIISVECNGG